MSCIKKNISRFMVIAVLLSVVAFAASSCGRPSPEIVLKRMDKHMEDLELNLTTIQKQKYEDVKKAIEAQMKRTDENIKNAFATLDVDAARDDGNLDNFFKSLNDMHAKREEGLKTILVKAEDFYASLDTAQKKKVVAELKSKSGRFKWLTR